MGFAVGRHFVNEELDLLFVRTQNSDRAGMSLCVVGQFHGLAKFTSFCRNDWSRIEMIGNDNYTHYDCDESGERQVLNKRDVQKEPGYSSSESFGPALGEGPFLWDQIDPDSLLPVHKNTSG